MKKIIATILSLILVFSTSTTSLAAENSMTYDEAIQYLQNYSITETNELGKEITTQYVFHSQEDLIKAATYISDNGLSSFNAIVNTQIQEAIKNDPQPSTLIGRSVTPAAAYATIPKSDGTHQVSATGTGLASFKTLGTLEYIVTLRYKVKVVDKKMTAINNIAFSINPSSCTTGSYSYPSYCNSTGCGVTANYTVVKSVQIAINEFDFEIRSETDDEIFALLTNFS